MFLKIMLIAFVLLGVYDVLVLEPRRHGLKAFYRR